jgi:hypothetical protein
MIYCIELNTSCTQYTLAYNSRQCGLKSFVIKIKYNIII